MSLNDILFRYNTSGASATTAKQDKLTSGGVKASHSMAKVDLPKLQKYATDFIAAGEKNGLPPALLAAISSRETRGGSQLSKSGYGSNGADFGLMQVNKDSHKLVGGPFSREHINQAAGILRDFRTAVAKKHKSWTPEQQLRGAVAAYNFGDRNVQTLDGMDVGTANDDYSSDVWARAQFLAPYFGGGAGAGTNTPAPKTNTGSSTSTVPVVSSQAPLGAQSEAVVRELQMLLVKYGYMTEPQVQTGPGILGPKTRAAVAQFLDEHARLGSGGTSGLPTTGNTVSTGGTSSGGGSSNTGSNAPVKPVAEIDGVPLYKQSDSRWGKEFLGAAKDKNIAKKGCAMTSTAMAISKISGNAITPLDLDKYLDSHGGYSGNNIVWDVAAKSRGLRATVPFPSWSLTTLDKELAAGRPVVTGVDYKLGDTGGGANGTDHWVTITGKYTQGGKTFYSAHDPANGQKFSFFVDGNVLRANLSTGCSQNYFSSGEIRTFKAATKNA